MKRFSGNTDRLQALHFMFIVTHTFTIYKVQQRSNERNIQGPIEPKTLHETKNKSKMQNYSISAFSLLRLLIE